MISDVAKKIFIYMLGIATVFSAIGFIIFPQIGFNIIYGIAIGTLVSCFRFLSIEKSFTKAVEKEANQAKVYARVKYLVRMLVVVAIMVLAAMNHPFINIYGLGLGLVSLQIAIVIYGKVSAKGKS